MGAKASGLGETISEQYLREAREIVRAAANGLSAGKSDLSETAEKLEHQARIWGQSFLSSLLNEVALKGLPPAEFESRTAEFAEEIITLAVKNFAVQSSRTSAAGGSPVLVGLVPAVVVPALENGIDTRSAIFNYLKSALASPPTQYRRESESLHRLNSRLASAVATSSQSDSGLPKKPIGRRRPRNRTKHPKTLPIYERISPDDPNHDLIKNAFIKSWADSHGFVADAFAGQASLSDFIMGCVTTFQEGAEVQVALKDEAPLSERCGEIDRLAKKSIALVRRKITPESKRLGRRNVKAAMDEFSRRVGEIAARSKQAILQSELESGPARTKLADRASDDVVDNRHLVPRSEPIELKNSTIQVGNSGGEVLGLSKANDNRRLSVHGNVAANKILVKDGSLAIDVGDTLIRTLPNGLQQALIVDDPGFREKIMDIPAHFAVIVHKGPPIDSLRDSDFWLERRQRLTALANRQEAELRDKNERRWLTAGCSRSSGTPEWISTVFGGLDAVFNSEFEEIVTPAAHALGSPQEAKPVEFWVYCLCEEMRDQPTRYGGLFTESLSDGAMIHDLVAGSMAYCSRLAAIAEIKAHGTFSKPGSQSQEEPATVAFPEEVEVDGRISATRSDSAAVAKNARAMTVAKLIKELDILHPQMFDDESEYARLCKMHPGFLTFKIAEVRSDLKLKVLAIQGSTRHIRLAQELAASHHGRKLSTIQDDWKRQKPSDFKRSASA